MMPRPKQKQLLPILFLLFSFVCQSQKLDLPELQNFTAKSPETANSFLLTKGWEFIGSEKGADNISTVVRWEFIPSGKSESTNFLELSTFEKQPSSLRYEFIQKEYYLAIMAQFTVNGYKLIEDNIENQKVSATYSSTNFSLVLNYRREEGNAFTSYEIILTRKSKTAATTLATVAETTSEKKKEFDEKGILISEYFLKDGKREGAITYFYPDGKIKKEAVMKAGIENGPATIYNYDKNQKLLTKTTGVMANDKQEGIWLKNQIVNNGLFAVEMTTYENGVKQGEFRSISNDSLILMNYKNDLLEGNYRIFLNYKPTIKITEADTTQLTRIHHGFYVENKKIGLWKSFDNSGSMTEEGYFLNDAKTGKWKYYYPTTTSDSNIPAAYSGKLFLEETYKGTKRNGESIRYSMLKKEEIPCSGSNEKKCYRYAFDSFTEKSVLADNVLNGDYELVDSENKIIKKGFYLDGKETGKWTLRNDSRIVKRDTKTTETGTFQVGMKEGKWERTDDKNQVFETYNYKDGNLNGDYTFFQNSKPVEKWRFDKGQFTELVVLDAEENPATTYVLSDMNGDNYICKKTEKNKDGVCVKTFSIKSKVPKEENTFAYKTDFDAMPDNFRLLNGPYILKNTEGNVLEEGNYLENNRTGNWQTYYYDQNVKTDFLYAGGNVVKEIYFDLKKKELFSGEFIYKDKNSEITEERKVKDGFRHGTTRFKDAKDKTIKKESYKEGVLKE